MKCILLIKTVILVSLFSLISHAAPTSSEIPYYGDDFYQDLSSGISNKDLLTSIKKVLRSFHAASANSNDRLVASCNGEKNCYSHVPVGYSKARLFLMGNFICR